MNKKVNIKTIIIILLLGIIIALTLVNLNNKNSNIEKQETSKEQLTTTASDNAYITVADHLSEVNAQRTVITGSADLISAKGSDASAATYPSFTLDVSNFSSVTIVVTKTYSSQKQLEVFIDDVKTATVAPGTYTYDISSATTLKFAHQVNISTQAYCQFTYTLE